MNSVLRKIHVFSSISRNYLLCTKLISIYLLILWCLSCGFNCFADSGIICSWTPVSGDLFDHIIQSSSLRHAFTLSRNPQTLFRTTIFRIKSRNL